TTEGSATTSVTEDGIQTVQALTGQTYQFATTRPPTLVTSNPFNGQLNVDPALTQIDLTFDVSVVSFDGVAELYSRGTDELVATLTAINGLYSGNIGTLDQQVVETISFAIPPGVLHPDSLYYLKIAQGEYNPITNIGRGISDEAQNFFGGISYNGTLYFKVSSPHPPVMKATDQSKYSASTTSATSNATVDQFGKAYFLVLDADHDGAEVTNAHILDPTTYPQYATAYVANGSFES